MPMETTIHFCQTNFCSRYSNPDILKCFNDRQYSKRFLGFCLATSQETVCFYLFQCFAVFWNTLSKVSKLSWRSKRKIFGRKFSACMIIILPEGCGHVQFFVSLLTLLIFWNQDTSKVNFLWAWCRVGQFSANIMIIVKSLLAWRSDVCFLRV